MARPTDTERGALLAAEIASGELLQPSLFPDAIPPEFWADICRASADQLTESRVLREAISHG